MRKSKYSEEQIIGFLRQAEAGMAVAEICRKGGFSDATFYKWRSKFGGMEASDAKRLRELEAENAKLKKLLAEAHLDMHALKSWASIDAPCTASSTPKARASARCSRPSVASSRAATSRTATGR